MYARCLLFRIYPVIPLQHPHQKNKNREENNNGRDRPADGLAAENSVTSFNFRISGIDGRKEKIYQTDHHGIKRNYRP